ncbi:Zinc finger SWIM domain-containing protein sws1 [Wickerhamomyces ciferrii]|uniref:Zinc finger SWIM domain-containing protein sws1 n=1 Tax=Wickerhamomyces ciferrii (strain ATCC 14091 / BCRC 22168 / CBS 111 / JCM 3599 / NBRC 0793 / NRRL Y-1031 F-60-10) TaxID=1206466 RepID=K0KHP7_WICCF|nr:Zinc finger SWIM domain-containing protein sws1 [Wickerhamomyces ciferrii]CCH40899.1 Zinc finger SWIM domain-containing protein sws1 [Wickerhamomyces ciferrii]
MGEHDEVEKFPEIVEGLISKLFLQNEDQDQDEIKIDDKISLTLTFIFPEIYLKSLDILDQKRIVIHKYNKSIDNANQLFNDSLVLINQDLEDTPYYIELNQWFCSCTRFQNGFKQIQCTSDTINTNIAYGIRFSNNLPQFKDPSNIPICEHLLSCYILNTHQHRLKDRYKLETVDQETWLTLHSKLL